MNGDYGGMGDVPLVIESADHQQQEQPISARHDKALTAAIRKERKRREEIENKLIHEAMERMVC